MDFWEYTSHMRADAVATCHVYMDVGSMRNAQICTFILKWTSRKLSQDIWSTWTTQVAFGRHVPELYRADGQGRDHQVIRTGDWSKNHGHNSAFGMGINCAGNHQVIHFGPPSDQDSFAGNWLHWPWWFTCSCDLVMCTRCCQAYGLKHGWLLTELDMGLCLCCDVLC